MVGSSSQLTAPPPVTRTWTDTNKDYTPQCDLTNPLKNGECAQISDLNFRPHVLPKFMRETAEKVFKLKP